jgi:hypothetical protein
MPVDPQIQALLDKGTGVPATRHQGNARRT